MSSLLKLLMNRDRSMALQRKPSLPMVVPLLAILLSVSTQIGQANDDSAKAPQLAPIRGIVVDESGKPVKNIRVHYQTWNKETASVSDADGKFSFAVEPNLDRQTTLIAVNEAGDAQAYYYDADLAAVPEQIELVLRPAKTFRVEVRDQQGGAVSGATVCVQAISNKGLGKFVTGDQGSAVIALPRDAKLLSVYALKTDVGLDYFPFERPDSRLGDSPNSAFVDPEPNEPIRFVLNCFRQIKVRVQNEKGEPFPNVQVSPWIYNLPNKGEYLNLGGLDDFQQKTDENGMAELRTIPADNVGQITISVEHRGYVAPERYHFNPGAGQEEIVAVLLPLIPVHGKVLLPNGNGAPFSQVDVTGAGLQFEHFSTRIKTDQNGDFEVRVNPNQYYMFASRLERQVSNSECRVVRPGRPIEPIELKLQAGTRIFGRVTLGPDQKPVGKQFIQLHREPAVNYQTISKEEQLPNPKNDRSAIHPRITDTVQTDLQGRFEFWTGSGKHSMIRLLSRDAVPQFDVDDETELEFNFHNEEPDTIPFEASVAVQRLKRTEIANTTVEFAGEGFNLKPWQVATDLQGCIAVERTPVAMRLFSSTSEGLLAGITDIDAEATTTEILLTPTAAARGRLVDAATGNPLAGIDLEYGIKITNQEGSFSIRFGGNLRTNANGEFVLTGLIPNETYDLRVVMKRSPDGSGREWRAVCQIAVENSGCFGLDDLKIERPRDESLGDPVDRAFETQEPHLRRLARTQREAELADRQLLIVVGEKQDPQMRGFLGAYYQTADGDDRNSFIEAFDHYVLLAVDPAVLRNDPLAREWSKRIEAESAVDAAAQLIILETDGSVVGREKLPKLFDKESFSLARATEFLSNHARPVPNAAKAFVEAQAEARRDEKQILLLEVAPYSAPSALWSRWLDAHREILAKDFVLLKVSRRHEEGEALLRKLQGVNTGAPWLAIIDSAGKVVMTNQHPSRDGVIEYPNDLASSKVLYNRFRKVVRRLTADDVEKIFNELP